MTLHVRAKMLCNVWSYDFYDMTLSTEEQRHFMINIRFYSSVVCYTRQKKKKKKKRNATVKLIHFSERLIVL